MRSDRELWKSLTEGNRLYERLSIFIDFYGESEIYRAVPYAEHILPYMKVILRDTKVNVRFPARLPSEIEDVYDKLSELYRREWNVEKMIRKLPPYSATTSPFDELRVISFLFNSWYVCIAPAYYSLFVSKKDRWSSEFEHKDDPDICGIYKGFVDRAKTLKRRVDSNFSFNIYLDDFIDEHIDDFKTFNLFVKSFRGFKDW